MHCCCLMFTPKPVPTCIFASLLPTAAGVYVEHPLNDVNSGNSPGNSPGIFPACW